LSLDDFLSLASPSAKAVSRDALFLVERFGAYLLFRLASPSAKKVHRRSLLFRRRRSARALHLRCTSSAPKVQGASIVLKLRNRLRKFLSETFLRRSSTNYQLKAAYLSKSRLINRLKTILKVTSLTALTRVSLSLLASPKASACTKGAPPSPRDRISSLSPKAVSRCGAPRDSALLSRFSRTESLFALRLACHLR